MQDDLVFLYRQLREQLDAAYAAAPWDGERIDCIALDLLAIERSLALHGVVPDAASGYSDCHLISAERRNDSTREKGAVRSAPREIPFT